MSGTLDRDTPVFVVGAGIMGAGVAQVAAQAGHAVKLFDAREGAAAVACAKLAATLDGLAAKGKLDPAEAKATAARISAAAGLDDAAGAGLVVEAIVENADTKRGLFRDLGDAPGMVVARTIAMLVNEACDAVLQGVCTAEGADLGVKLGVNYPAGPFEWLAQWDASAIAAFIDRLDRHYRGERYRVSPELRQRAWAAQLAR